VASPPLEGVNLRWHGSAGAEVTSPFVESGADGRFEIGGLVPGELELEPRDRHATPPRYFPRTRLTLTRDAAVELRAYPAGARLTVRFPKGGPTRTVLRGSGERQPRETHGGAELRFEAVPPGAHTLEYRVVGEIRRRAVNMGGADQVLVLDDLPAFIEPDQGEEPER
jgi:hypothetical protein